MKIYKPRFSSYSSIYSYLSTTTGYPAYPLYTAGSDGNDSNIIGYWGKSSTGNISMLGECRFNLVTPTMSASAASVAGSVITVTAGHNITTLSKVLRVWNTTDGTLIADVASGSWSRSGNDIIVDAVTAAAVGVALGAAKVVRLWVEGVSELCIGGATCAVQPLAGAWIAFGTGVNGDLLAPCCGKYSGPGSYVYATLSGAVAPAANGDHIMIGWGSSAAVHALGGTGVVLTGHRIGVRISATQAATGAAMDSPPNRIGLSFSARIAGTTVTSMNVIGPDHAGTPVGYAAAFGAEAGLVGAPVMISAVVAGTAGAVCSVLSVRSA